MYRRLWIQQEFGIFLIFLSLFAFGIFPWFWLVFCLVSVLPFSVTDTTNSNQHCLPRRHSNQHCLPRRHSNQHCVTHYHGNKAVPCVILYYMATDGRRANSAEASHSFTTKHLNRGEGEGRAGKREREREREGLAQERETSGGVQG